MQYAYKYGYKYISKYHHNFYPTNNFNMTNIILMFYDKIYKYLSTYI